MRTAGRYEPRLSKRKYIRVKPGSSSVLIPENVKSTGLCGSRMTVVVTVNIHPELMAASRRSVSSIVLNCQPGEEAVGSGAFASMSIVVRAHALSLSDLSCTTSNQTVNCVGVTVVAPVDGVNVRSASVMFVRAATKVLSVLLSFSTVRRPTKSTASGGADKVGVLGCTRLR